MSAIFLSASIPDPTREGQEHYYESADAVAISSAVNALIYVVLGHRQLIWGGHPAITPIVKHACAEFKVNYTRTVKLYQSKWWHGDYPEDNAQFRNVVFTDRKENKDASLDLMRRTMFEQNRFSAAVFIGGMKGILDEARLFREFNREAQILPVMSTGGAALEVKNGNDAFVRESRVNMDYVGMFARYLQIDLSERRRSDIFE